MTVKTYEWDASLYVDNASSRADVLADGLEDRDPAHLRSCMAMLARAIGMTEIARLAAIPRPVLYDALRAAEDGDAAPLASIAGVVQRALEPVAEVA